MNEYSATEQPDPIQNEKPAAWDMVIKDIQTYSFLFPADDVTAAVIADMKARDEWGLSKYKTRLQPFNGRDALIDFYQELLDAAVYSAQYIYELDQEDGKADDEYRDLLDVYDNLLFAIRTARERIFKRDGH
jgi:hypothetical protein